MKSAILIVLSVLLAWIALIGFIAIGIQFIKAVNAYGNEIFRDVGITFALLFVSWLSFEASKKR